MKYRRTKAFGGTFFFTLVTYQRNRLFANKENINLLKTIIQKIKLNHPFQINAFVILPDHLHCIWTLSTDDTDYSTRWRLIKSDFTRQCGEKNKREKTSARLDKKEQCVWQRRFWEHQIKDEQDFNHQ